MGCGEMTGAATGVRVPVCLSCICHPHTRGRRTRMWALLLASLKVSMPSPCPPGAPPCSLQRAA